MHKNFDVSIDRLLGLIDCIDARRSMPVNSRIWAESVLLMRKNCPNFAATSPLCTSTEDNKNDSNTFIGRKNAEPDSSMMYGKHCSHM